MYIFKLKLSEKARGYCMYVFLAAIYSLIVNENLIQCCLHPDKVMKVFCIPLILYKSCRHVSNFALGC